MFDDTLLFFNVSSFFDDNELFFEGERADAIRQMKTNWFVNLHPGGDLPAIRLPRCNGKTSPRDVPMIPAMVALLLAWLEDQPLKGSDGNQWPFQGIEHQDPYLFPALHKKAGRGQCWMRDWLTPVSCLLSCNAIVAHTVSVSQRHTRENPMAYRTMQKASSC